MKAYPPFVNFFEMSKETIVRCEKQKPRFHAFLKVWPFMFVYFCLSSEFHDFMSKKKNLIHKKKPPTWFKFDRFLHPQSFDCLPLQILNLSEEVTLCPLALVHLWLTLTLFNFYQNCDPSTWVVILRIWQATPSLQLAKSGGEVKIVLVCIKDFCFHCALNMAHTFSLDCFLWMFTVTYQ